MGYTNFNIDWADAASHKLSEKGERLLRESIEDFENGNYTTYDSLDDLNRAIAEIARNES